MLPEKFVGLAMMSKAWCVKNGVECAQDFNGRQETYAVRNANGTGPFRLERYEPDVKTVLKAYPDGWGRKVSGWDKRNGQLDEVSFVSIRQDATRLAALASGEIDLVLDPPFQEVPRLKRDKQFTLLQIADIDERYFSFDQWHDELEGSDVKGRNPFKDLRVRRAVYQALNIDLIVQKVLRGSLFEPGARWGDRRDPRRARRGAQACDGQHGAAHDRRRSAVPTALPPHAQLGDEQEHERGAVAE